MPEYKKQNYLHGAVILTAAVAIVKILGMIYKIPIRNILGTEGFGLFNMAYNIYAVVLALSTAGLPVAVSRMISEANSQNRPMQVRKIFSTATVAFIILGAVGSAAMLLYPTELADFMGNVKASQAIKILAPSIFLCCLMSAFRGYSQGLSDMMPTAASQVIEVAVKVAFGIAALLILQNRGASSAIMLSGATSGVAVGSFFACLYIGVVAVRRMRTQQLRYSYREAEAGADMSVDRRSTILKNLVKIGIPIAFGASVLAIINLVNTKVIIERLCEIENMTEELATSLFGDYSSALLLYNLPLAVITPLTVSVVPAISGFLAQKKLDDAKGVIESCLRISTIIALPMGVGLSVLAGPVMNTMFVDSAEQGVGLLAIMGISSFFLCMSMITQAVLQASGKERLPAMTMIVGGVISIAVSWYLLPVPAINIYGAAIGYLLCNIFMFALNLIFVMTKQRQKPSLKNVFLRPVINSLVMGLAAWITYPAVLGLIGAGPEPESLETVAALGGAVLVGVAVYAVLTIATKSITLEDMKLIPKGEALARLLRIK